MRVRRRFVLSLATVLRAVLAGAFGTIVSLQCARSRTTSIEYSIELHI